MKYKSCLLSITLAGWFLIAAGCVGQRLGGMTVKEAFPDDRVASLVRAVVQGNYKEADRQIAAGANVNAVGTQGVSPLIWVMIRGSRKGMEYLLKAGADPNYRAEQESALSLAAGGDKPELLELLLQYKGDPDLRGPRNESLLHIAVGEFRQKNIDLLLKYGADINIHNDGGDTAAIDAVRLGNYGLAVYFLENGLSYNLEGLAISAEARHVPAESENCAYKKQLINMLRDRGVNFPAWKIGKAMAEQRGHDPCLPEWHTQWKELKN